jgi:peptidoglycan-N-acetylglucosamine deacetylase
MSRLRNGRRAGMMRKINMRGALALVIAAAFLVPAARAEPEPPQAGGIAADELEIEACASDPGRLGLSRVVEIDTANGPQFGGSHGADTAFLKDGEVVLTFDDGPMRAYTRLVLKALAAHCTKATFFLVGRMAAADPAMVREVAGAGHTIGSHTWSHQNLAATGMLKGRQELERGISAIAKARGASISPFFRFPFLSGSRPVEEYAKSRSIASFWIDVDSKDYQTRDSGIVNRRIMSQLAVQRKGIILMHDIQPSTAKGIMTLLDDLRDKGFKVVHMVPKAAVDTIAAYDSSAGKAADAKAAMDDADPLASRSIVYTMAPAAAGAAAAAKQKPKAKAKTARARSSAQASAETLPWTGSVKKTASKPKKVQPAKTETFPWQIDIFNY